eukprot:CAMPEP_0181228238 /NCGR_PEP_ID=MMETSP1096-20121128/33243_1 /TAXON_ID=156174 ORGANISM="Chrysochromulina ericina, Strain CCMP281" /NCGR_SAMPLE_ID=MMETSP1096 /ASSEMBLY_ACC=CAM_ASM_000453 /LENGTH=75 /DNA_ID=CAMNT_0023321753 /DNA_START=121 /DNA_END=349 /DNA_ORIENTATION=+
MTQHASHSRIMIVKSVSQVGFSILSQLRLQPRSTHSSATKAVPYACGRGADAAAELRSATEALYTEPVSVGQKWE